MEKIKTLEQFASRRQACEKCLDAKFHSTDGTYTLLICGGLGCETANSLKLKERLLSVIKERGLEDTVKVDEAGCFGFCSEGPFVKVFPDDVLYRLVKPEDAEKIIDEHIVGGRIVTSLCFKNKNGEAITKEHDVDFYKKQVKIALYGVGVINPERLDDAIGYGAFQGLIRAFSMTPQEVIDEVLASGLRGRGGGGFPTGKKWQFALDQINDTKYVVCNGDEGDPGAFMDRSALEGSPFSVIEGMMIAGYAIGAQNGYFYVRAEYPLAIKRLRNAIKLMEEAGLLGENILGSGFSFRAHLRLGAGAFVCGEETALLNSIEGQRGMPRPRPPFPAVKGLWGKPTIINNVETLACVPYILRNGAASFNKYGTEKSKGTKVFALGGKVNNVGLVEVPMGTTLRELIYDIGGGVPNGKRFKAIQTGGPSGGCLTEKDLDTPIDYDNLIAAGSMMGSGGAIVMDEDNCMVDVAKFYMEFIVDESCGKCSPCRIGTRRILEYLSKITRGTATKEDLDELKALCDNVRSNSLCGLGQTAPNPVLSTMRSFYNEYLEHVEEKRCDAHVCKDLMRYVIKADVCKKCGMCARNCPTHCITGELGKTAYKIDQSKCIKCGSCFSTCPFKAIEKI